MELTSREIATVIIAVGFVVLSFTLSNDRKKLLQALLGVVKALAAWKVAVAILAYMVFLFGVVLAANFLGVWNFGLLKDTIIIAFFVGLPILFASTNFNDGTAMLKHVTKEVLGVGALLILYINLTPFPLWGELMLQVSLLFSTIIVVVAKGNPEYASVGRLFEALMSITLLGLIVYVTVQVVKRFPEFDWEHEAEIFALSVWLPVSLIPFIYCFALFATCEATLVRLKFHNGRQKLPLFIVLGFLTGVYGSLRYATNFAGRWLPELAAQGSLLQVSHVMRQYRRSVRDNARRERAVR